MGVEKFGLETLVRLPAQGMMFGLSRAVGAVREGRRLVAPTYTQREFAQKLAAEHVLNQASSALELVDIGLESGNSLIIFDARAKLANLAINAEASPVITDQITTQVVGMAKRVRVDPEFEPLLDDNTQAAYSHVYDMRGKVLDMSTYRQS